MAFAITFTVLTVTSLSVIVAPTGIGAMVVGTTFVVS